MLVAVVKWLILEITNQNLELFPSLSFKGIFGQLPMKKNIDGSSDKIIKWSRLS